MWTTLPCPTALPLGSCFSLGESPCLRARGSVNELLHSTLRWEAFGKGKLHWVLTKCWLYVLMCLCRGSGEVCWGVRSRVYHKSGLLQPLFLLKPADGQICPVFFKKGKVCRKVVRTNTYSLIFILLSLGMWKKLVSFWTRCPCGWLLKSLPFFFVYHLA